MVEKGVNGEMGSGRYLHKENHSFPIFRPSVLTLGLGSSTLLDILGRLAFVVQS